MIKITALTFAVIAYCLPMSSAVAANQLTGVIWEISTGRYVPAIGAEIIAISETGQSYRTSTQLVYVGGWQSSGYAFPNLPRGRYFVQAKYWNPTLRRFQYGQAGYVDFRRTDFGRGVLVVYLR